MIRFLKNWFSNRTEALDEEFLWNPMRERGVSEEDIAKARLLHEELSRGHSR